MRLEVRGATPARSLSPLAGVEADIPVVTPNSRNDLFFSLVPTVFNWVIMRTKIKLFLHALMLIAPKVLLLLEVHGWACAHVGVGGRSF